MLLTVLHRYLSSGDAMASPRIAAKAKSSIAAKPGGESSAEQPLARYYKLQTSCSRWRF